MVCGDGGNMRVGGKAMRVLREGHELEVEEGEA